mmetsp:Transcript_49634/g.84922  ORF Transcript_49634/g.84922 Transcript_49634/m.84922 type:complete len:115 (+) Transcript_49634:187-531(+)
MRTTSLQHCQRVPSNSTRAQIFYCRPHIWKEGKQSPQTPKVSSSFRSSSSSASSLQPPPPLSPPLVSDPFTPLSRVVSSWGGGCIIKAGVAPISKITLEEAVVAGAVVWGPTIV